MQKHSSNFVSTNNKQYIRFRAQSSLGIFAQKYLRKCEDTYFILQNKYYLCFYNDSFGVKILRDDCALISLNSVGFRELDCPWCHEIFCILFDVVEALCMILYCFIYILTLCTIVVIDSVGCYCIRYIIFSALIESYL